MTCVFSIFYSGAHLFSYFGIVATYFCTRQLWAAGRPGEPSKEVRAAAVGPPHIPSSIFWQKMTQKTLADLNFSLFCVNIFNLQSMFVFNARPQLQLCTPCAGGGVLPGQPEIWASRGCRTKLWVSRESWPGLLPHQSFCSPAEESQLRDNDGKQNEGK